MTEDQELEAMMARFQELERMRSKFEAHELQDAFLRHQNYFRGGKPLFPYLVPPMANRNIGKRHCALLLLFIAGVLLFDVAIILGIVRLAWALA